MKWNQILLAFGVLSQLVVPAHHAVAAVVAGCTHMGTACAQSPLSGEDVGTAASYGGGDRTELAS